jgi:hypothetical protein
LWRFPAAEEFNEIHYFATKRVKAGTKSQSMNKATAEFYHAASSKLFLAHLIVF